MRILKKWLETYAKLTQTKKIDPPFINWPIRPFLFIIGGYCSKSPASAASETEMASTQARRALFSLTSALWCFARAIPRGGHHKRKRLDRALPCLVRSEGTKVIKNWVSPLWLVLVIKVDEALAIELTEGHLTDSSIANQRHILQSRNKIASRPIQVPAVQWGPPFWNPELNCGNNGLADRKWSRKRRPWFRVLLSVALRAFANFFLNCHHSGLPT